MTPVEVRLPMMVQDPKTGQSKQGYAVYSGEEVVVNEGERKRYHTARLFHLRNKKEEEYIFRIRGNGQYEMHKVMLGNSGPIASGTMMDRFVPEIISQAR